MPPLSAALLTAVLLVASITDLKCRIVPNRLTAAAGLCGLVLAGAGGLSALGVALLASAAVSAPLFLISLARPAGIGMGDAKLVAVLALFLGWQILPALLTGFLLAGLTGALVCLGGRTPPSRVALPLAPFLAAGTLPVLLSSLQLLQ